MTKNTRFGALRAGLLGSAALLMFGGLANAADDTMAAPEEVVVTGTRIPRPEYDLPSPTMTLDSASIQHSGTINLTDYLKRVPALVGSLGDYQTNGYATPSATDASSLGGLNLLDLRNLGYVRTLVLIDGKRSVGESTGSAAIDVATIPITLIDRVEVATGGASAIYGADGVSGVVNFILKHNLEGIHAQVQAGTSEDGGGSKSRFDISVGHNFDDDKGNITFTVEGTLQDHLFFTQRKFTNTGTVQFFVANPANLDGSNLALPANIPTTDAQYLYSAPTGAVWSDFFNQSSPDFLGNGQPYIPGIDIGNASRIGSSGMPYAEDLQADFQPTTRRAIAELDGTYEFNRFFNLTGSFKYAHVETRSLSSAPFDDIAILNTDNAFLPANIVTAINAGGTGVGILSEDYLAIRNQEEVKRDTYRGTLELNGDLPDVPFLENFKYNASYVYGQTDVDDINLNNRVTDRFFAALDSVIDPGTGLPTCRSNLDPLAVPPDIGGQFSDTTPFDPANWPLTFTPGANSGCVAYNPFGPNAASKAAIAFVTADTHNRGTLTQNVATAYVSGDFPAFQNWGFAGPLSAVAGAEYRKETSSTNPDFLSRSDDVWIGGTQPVRGSFDVYEFFAELSLDVMKDSSWGKSLSLDGAVRQSQYSTAGSSTSWKYGGVYAPIEGLKFRATDAVAVRAPNIGELFAPTQSLFSFVNDPCDYTQVNEGTSFRPANCAALYNAMFGPGAYDPHSTQLNTGFSVSTLVTGNDLLKPETAHTFTAGIVLQPTFLEGLVVTADWYDVKITNAILALSGQTIAQECVDLSTIANPFCAQITRDPGATPPGAIAQISTQLQNVASIGTGGVDFTFDYTADTNDWFGHDYGTVNFHLIGNWLDHLTFQAIANEAPTQGAGTLGGGFDGSPAPRWQTNLDTVWHFENWTIDYNIDWYSHVLRSTIQAYIDQPNIYDKKYLYIPDRFVQGIQVGYDVDNAWNVYAGVDNLFYQKPAIGQSAYPVDPIGRFFYLGVKSNLDFSDLPL